MKLKRIIESLEEAADQLGVRVRRETADFRGGKCTLGDETVILLNKRHPPEVHLSVLAESLRGMAVDSIYLKPSVRSALEEEWDRQAAIDDAAGTYAGE